MGPIERMAADESRDMLPDAYRILPVSVPFVVSSHRRQYAPSARMLVPQHVDSEEWYQSLIDRLVGAIGKQYLPLCRMGDGEFMFCVGHQPPDLRLPWLTRMKARLRLRYDRWRLGGNFMAHTPGHYHSGEYTPDEQNGVLKQYGMQIKMISDKGILAPLLTYHPHPPYFQEQYFPAMGRWFKENDIELTLENMTAFYYIYALFTGPRRHELIRDRRVLVVNGADEVKRQAIIQGLKREGAREVHWCSISLKRSLFDKIDVTPWIGEVDIAFVGAGIGKSNILLQMEPLGVPCVDVGYIFEVWASPQAALKRAMCISDEDWARHQQGSL